MSTASIIVGKLCTFPSCTRIVAFTSPYGVIKMSTGAKNAKRPKTIDYFFAPKNPAKFLGPNPLIPSVKACGVGGDIANTSGMAEPQGEQPRQPDDGRVTVKGSPADLSVPSPARKQRSPVAGRKRREDGVSDAADPSDAELAPSASGIPDDSNSKDDRAQEADPPPQPAATTAEQQDPSPVPDDGLTPAQRAQIVANRNRALARRAVAEASAPGAPPLRLSALLVDPGWRSALSRELGSETTRQLEAFLHGEWAPGRKKVFPPREYIFQAFNACPFEQVRVVLLGQDPYHGEGQAMGLSFSVPRDLKRLPPSLLNIYKEAAADLGWPDRPQHGDLTSWNVQGVLLLNTCLTVRQGEPNSHAKRGWEQLTDAAIRTLSQRRSGLVFLLWGKSAQAKESLVDTKKHHVLKAGHPSPMSVTLFTGCRHFSKTNQLLQAQGLPPIDWRPT